MYSITATYTMNLLCIHGHTRTHTLSVIRVYCSSFMFSYSTLIPYPYVKLSYMTKFSYSCSFSLTDIPRISIYIQTNFRVFPFFISLLILILIPLGQLICFMNGIRLIEAFIYFQIATCHILSLVSILFKHRS